MTVSTTSSLTRFRNLNNDLTAVAAHGMTVHDRMGGRYYLRLHGTGCINPTIVTGVTVIPWLAGWINHLLRHSGQWEIYLDDYPATTALDFNRASTLLSSVYPTPREAYAAIIKVAALIQQTPAG